MKLSKEKLKNSLLLYGITDSHWLKEGENLIDAIEDALKGGVTMIQYREKNLNREDKIKEGKEILNLVHNYDIPLIINDDYLLAKEIGADGVHLGQSDIGDLDIAEISKDMIVGISVPNVKKAKEAEKLGASYIGVNSSFETKTKKDAQKSKSIDDVEKIVKSVNIPAVAIGGIDLDNMKYLKDTGISGIAVVSSIFKKDKKKESAEKLLKKASKYFKKDNMKVALTIAGSDSSGGAGIQADIKTMTLNGVYAESIITALTAQNTMGVRDVLEVSPKFLKEEFDAVFTDIYPDAIKIGMVSNKELIKVISQKLREYDAKNVVLDPVMVATSGSKLLNDDSIKTLIDELFPLSFLITPNIPEAEIISDMKIDNEFDMEVVAKYISDTYDVNVLLKGGHMINDANDYFYGKDKALWIKGKRIDNPNTHGTGCTLSSAIASNLAKGYDLIKSIKLSKKYLEGALSDGLDLGHGSGPMNHGYVLKDKKNKYN